MTFLDDNVFYWEVQGRDLEMVMFLLSHGAWHPDAVFLAQMHRDAEFSRLIEEQHQVITDEHEYE